MGNEEKNGKIVSVINMKGGVGKTTLSIGLSDFLSDLNNCKVLLIDADPQFNSTQALLGMATLFLTKIIRCCECCGVMATIALDNEHPRI